ncbi:MAG: sigma-54-dependent Fis family transcriptional regulator [Pseudomonadales bacterium]|nr:sigma-54-dependent Fis family transcriptional regulator [Pseudomonadales bacterium]MCP5345951.1 sigma-54-dependent Fis family transcriptional regulator [Pseudomonadales bacterium]
MAEHNKILLIDDDDRSRRDLEVILGFLGESVVAGNSGGWLASRDSDYTAPARFCLAMVGQCREIGVVELLLELSAWDKGLPVLLLGEGRLVNLDASDSFKNITGELSFPLTYQPLLDALHQAKVFRDNYNRLRDLGGVRDYNMFRSLVGNSGRIQQVRQLMGQVANKEVTVLITGESGTGKEVVARNLHLNSPRSEEPFVPINCGAIPRDLLESELFGHEKGAFTGATSSREGRFELANGGTLFLDEIGDMPLSMQVKLLRVLQERSFERVGGIKTITTDVRIIAATHQNLESMIARGEFRQDLYYRINVFPIDMPPLRDRTGDIPLLLNELISTLENENRGSVRFNSGAIAALKLYHWPGNVRELANLVERMAILHPHGIVGEQDLPPHLRRDVSASPSFVGDQDSGSPLANDKAEVSPDEPSSEDSAELPLDGLDLKEYLANLEKDLINKALDDSRGVVARAADRLHIRRTTLVEKMRKYNLPRKGGDSQEADSEPAPLAVPAAQNGSGTDAGERVAVRQGQGDGGRDGKSAEESPGKRPGKSTQETPEPGTTGDKRQGRGVTS